MNDIILINPSRRLPKTGLGSHVPPFGLIYLRGELRKHGFKAKVVDASLPDFSESNFLRMVKQEKPLAVGFSFTTETRFEAFDLIRKVKEAEPKVLTLAGGPHPTLAHVDTITHIRDLDIIVRGEGERTLVELMRRAKAEGDFSKVPGLAFRSGGRLVDTGPAERISDLDSLESPYKDHEVMKQYASTITRGGQEYPVAFLFTGRGCPFKCFFCSSSVQWGRQTRSRSNENILAEMKYIIETYGINHFYFMDDTFNLNNKRLAEFLQRIIKELPPVKFMNRIRIDNLNYEILELMKRAGCFKVTYGVESADQDMVDKLIMKGIDLGRIPEIESWIKKLGLERRCFFIISLPGETRAMAQKTIDMAKSLGGETTISLLRINPGTRSEQIAKEKGFLPSDFTWTKADLSKTYLRSIIGSSPVYFEHLTWYDASKMLFQWASSEQKFFSIWEQIPKALMDVRSFTDAWKLAVLGTAFVQVKAGQLWKRAGAKIDCGHTA